MGSNKYIFTLLLSILFAPAWAQVNRYVVHLSDKNNSPYSVDAPLVYLSPAAIDRREKPIATEDLPVNPSYINQITDLGTTYLYQSRWFNLILIESTEAKITEVLGLPFVVAAEEVALGPNPGRKEDKLDVLGTEEASDAQNYMIGTDWLQSEGITGEGVKIAFLDAGFRGINSVAGFEYLRNNQLIRHTYNFVHQQENVDGYSDHGTKVVSTVSGLESMTYQGSAIDAAVYLYVTEDVSSEQRVEEYYWLFGAEMADSAGVDIISSSLGYNTFDNPSHDYTPDDLDGNTTVITKAADKAFEKGLVVITSAGNSGNQSWRTLTAPADGVNVLTVGSVTAQGVRSSFSSFGPSTDGRVKPDVMAMGSGVMVFNGVGNLVGSNGTSLAAPQVAGIVAGLMGEYPSLTNKEIIELIRFTASNYDQPNEAIGYGIANIERAMLLLGNEEQELPVLIYPNPTLDFVELKFKDPIENPTFALKIYSTEGRLLRELEHAVSWSTNPMRIDFNSFPVGVYLMQIISGNEITKLKVIKQ